MVFGGSESFPFFQTPRLLVSSDPISIGEPIPQLSVILRLIHENVHGAGLKPSELI